MTTVKINSNIVTPASQIFGGHHYEHTASGSNYLLVQFDSHLNEDQVEKLNHLYHLQVVDYVAENTYICRYEPAELDELRSISYVRYANVYHVDLVSSPALRSLAAEVGALSHGHTPDAGLTTDQPSVKSVQKVVGPNTVEVPVPSDFIVFVHDRDRLDSAREEISSVPGVDATSLVREGNTALRVKFDISALAAISRIDDVGHIEQIYPHRPQNFKAREVSGFSSSYPSTKNAGRGRKKVNEYKGKTQVVVVADTGFDTGSTTSPHPAFIGRVKEIKALNERNLQLDDHGHGTHVAGSVLGHGTSTQFPGVNIDGSAPEAHLIVQALGEADGSLNTRQTGGGLGSLFTGSGMMRFNTLQGGTDHPPRVHCNSWGNDWLESQTTALPYGDSQFLDQTVRDAQDWVLVFPAGNDGLKGAPPQVQTTSCSKNAIIVGACENAQPMMRQELSWLSLGLHFPFRKKTTIYAYDENRPPGTQEQVADFSSRGPSTDGRLKPDLVAPGAVVYSARSRTPDLLGASQQYYIGPIPIPILRKYNYNRTGISTDDLWWFKNGVSMAVPHVAGCCAVLRKAYIDFVGNWPSAAMVKALLVNGAVDLSIKGTDFNRHGGPAPNGVQGFGRVDIPRSLLPLVNKTGFVYDSLQFPASYAQPPLSVKPPKNPMSGAPIPRFLVQGGMKSFKFENPKVGTFLTVTLAYTDLAGAKLFNLLALGAARASHGGPEIYGLPNPNVTATENNVQRLIWRLEEVTTYRIDVICKRVKNVAPIRPGENVQDYALCYFLTPPP